MTIGERLLVHLSGFSRFAEAFECPPDATQEGIARALGISRAHAALELKRLRQNGLLTERVAHVTAGKVRRKVYFPTRSGEERARAIREFAKQKPLVLVDRGDRRDALGAEVLQVLRQLGLREVEAYQRILLADIVDLGVVRPPPTPTTEAPPFLGREAELDRIRRWAARPGSPVLAILGVTGIGKTALAERAAAASGLPSFVRRAYVFETARTFADALADFLADHGRPRLRNHLSSGAFDPASLRAILAQDLRGTFVVVDDADRSREVCAFLEMAAEASPDAKLLLTERSRPPAYDERDLAEGHAAELVLEGLDRRSAIALAARLGLPADPETGERIFALTRGHPLAIALLASTGLRAAERMRRFLEDAILASLDERATPALRALAVLRRPIEEPEALPLSSRTVRSLVRRGLLGEHPEGFTLHDLARDVLLARASPDDLRAAHARAARFWTRHGNPLESAHHALEARRLEDALAVLEPAAMALAESPRAAELVALLERLPENRRPRLAHARALESVARWAEAAALYGTLAARGGPGTTESLLGLGRIASKEGRYDEAERHLRAALEQAADIGTRGRAERLLAAVLRKRGTYTEAHAAIDAAVAHLTSDPRERTRALIDRAALLHDEGRDEEAVATLDAIDRNDLGMREAASLENNRAVALACLSRTIDAVAAFRRSAQAWREAGDARGTAYALANAGDALMALGRLEEARAALDEAAAEAGPTEDRVLSSMIEANVGKLLARLGDATAAEARLLRSVTLLENVDNPRSLRERCAELARFYAEAGDATAAQAWIARADRVSLPRTPS